MPLDKLELFTEMEFVPNGICVVNFIVPSTAEFIRISALAGASDFKLTIIVLGVAVETVFIP